MTRVISIVALVTALLLPHGAVSAQGARSQRFDLVVRADFFAGFAGDEARLRQGMDACEKALAENPKLAEALVWHGSGLVFQAGAAFQKGDMKSGGELWERGMKEMDEAVALEPENVGVLIPRGALLLQATRNMSPSMSTPLLQKAVNDYEKVLVLQAPIFSTLGDHPKGELLFGLAEGYSRLGQPEQARKYFERLVNDAPQSGQASKGKQYLADGTLPPTVGLGCVGCHK